MNLRENINKLVEKYQRGGLKRLLDEENSSDSNSIINYTKLRNIDPVREIKKQTQKIENVQKKNNVSRKKALEIIQKEEFDKNISGNPQSVGEIAPVEDQSIASKTWEVLTNPVTAASYWLNDQRIPDRFSKGERNNLDIATDLFNPFGIVDSAKNAVKETISLPKNLYDGEYREAGSNFLNAGLNTLSVIPALRELKGTKGLNKELENINPSLVDDFSESFGLLGRSTKRFAKTLPIKLLPGHSNRAEKALELGNNWNRDWYNNPITQDRLTNIINHSNFLERIDWKNMQEAIKDEAYISHFQSNLGKVIRFLDGKSHFHDDNLGFSITKLKESLDPKAPLNKNGTQSFVDKYRPPSVIKSIAIHEGNHNVYNSDSFSGTIFSSMLNKNPQKPLKDIPADKLAKYDEYLSIPEEIYARIQEIRAENRLAPGELLTDKMVDEIFNKGLSGKSNVDSRFYQLIDKDKFKKVVNVVPAVGAVGIGASTVSEKKLGGYRKSLDNLVEKYQKGGVTESKWEYSDTNGVLKPQTMLKTDEIGYLKGWLESPITKEHLNKFLNNYKKPGENNNKPLIEANSGELLNILNSQDDAVWLLNNIVDNRKIENNMWYAQLGGKKPMNKDQQIAWFKEYINSPKYLERLKKEYPNADEETITRLYEDRKNNFQHASKNISIVDNINNEKGTLGVNYARENDYRNDEKYNYRIHPTKAGNIEITKEGLKLNPSVITHEISHGITDGTVGMPTKTLIDIVNRTRGNRPDGMNTEGLAKNLLDPYFKDERDFIDKILPISTDTEGYLKQDDAFTKAGEEFDNPDNYSPFSDSFISKKFNNIRFKVNGTDYDRPIVTDYTSNPTEYLARMQSFRQELKNQGIYDASKEDFTEEHLNKFKESIRNGGGNSLLREMYPDIYELIDATKGSDSYNQPDYMKENDEDTRKGEEKFKQNIIWMMNNIAKNNSNNNANYAQRGGEIRNALNNLSKKFS